MYNNRGLFDDMPVPLPDGAVILRGFAAPQIQGQLVAAVQEMIVASPLRHMCTPGGLRMSVAMTSCGEAGWVSDARGYRYQRTDPLHGRPWPPMPPVFLDLARAAAQAAGFPGFAPDSCLINSYAPGTRLSLHQDRNERDFGAPIVSVSLGLPVVFLFGGARRSERPVRVRLASGDIVVWGGPARLAFHGVAPLEEGAHPLTGERRINLTFRKAL
jgi:alkylated DNA repair protein (DNA oxidative demethylase)